MCRSGVKRTFGATLNLLAAAENRQGEVAMAPRGKCEQLRKNYSYNF